MIFSVLFASLMLSSATNFCSINKTKLTSINEKIAGDEAAKLFDKGFDYFEQKNYAETSKFLGVSVGKGFRPALALQGESELHFRQLDLAENHLKEALEVKNAEKDLPGYYGKVQFDLGMIYYIQKDTTSAIYHLRKAKQLGNKDAEQKLIKLQGP